VKRVFRLRDRGPAIKGLDTVTRSWGDQAAR
jgi:hypothetical protein